MTPAEEMASQKGPTRSRKNARDFGVHKCVLRELRHELGLTIRDVSKGTGVSNPAICDIERGAECWLSTARRLAAFFGKTVDEVWPITKGASDGHGDSKETT